MEQEKIAVFPGSFDPITLGHTDVVRRALHLFDKIVIAVGQNTSKKSLLKPETRLKIIDNIFENEPKVEVTSFNELTVKFCKKQNAAYILRGLRNSKDFQYEQDIFAMNKQLAPEIESIFLYSSTDVGFISSTIVREITLNKGDISGFVPPEVLEFI